MALLKKSQYGGWEFDLGDDTIKAELEEQLKVTESEIASAINMENVADKLFARVLKNRSKAHQALLDKVPGSRD
jgi:hypothetical protein